MSQRTREAAWTLVGIGVVLIVLLQLYGTYQGYAAGKAAKKASQSAAETTQAIRDTQTEGSPFIIALTGIARDTRDTLDQLQDCVKANGECARDNRQRSAQYVQLIGLYVICAVRYTDLPEDDATQETNDCVARRTKQLDP
jgi:F0F1-type ATP synthase membrane subunit c/vacuolar-type H+-ATPase subunit K